jgi:hypothetical protein
MLCWNFMSGLLRTQSPEEDAHPPPANSRSITGIGARFTAVDVPAIPAVVWRWQIGKHCVDSVGRQIRSLRALEKIDPVTGARGDIVRAAHDSNCDVGYVVVGTAAVRKTRRIARESTEPLLIFRLIRREFKFYS